MELQLLQPINGSCAKLLYEEAFAFIGSAIGNEKIPDSTIEGNNKVEMILLKRKNYP